MVEVEPQCAGKEPMADTNVDRPIFLSVFLQVIGILRDVQAESAVRHHLGSLVKQAFINWVDAARVSPPPLSGATEHAQPPPQRIALDGNSYTEKDFAEWYGPQYHEIWNVAPPLNQEPQDLRAPTTPAGASSSIQQGGAPEHAQPPLERIALDGKKYTEKDFIEWYGPQYRECWDLASPSYPQPQEPGTPTPKPPTPPPKSASASSPVQEGMAVLQNPPPQGGAAEHSLQVPPPSPLPSPTPTAAAARSTTSNLTLQCPACKRVLCRTDDLAFFRRVFRCVEVHLMLKPENNVPDTFKRSAVSEKGALHSWNCACGAKLGDTRPVAVKHAPMTAFKSASVMLCGCHFTGEKSKWPTVYNTPPFDCIEVRDRDTYFGAPL